ncbi:MAG: protein kinase [Anaerolineales bacterium]|nr:MAG: protein kinase [Anaerolineales bacterium]
MPPSIVGKRLLNQYHVEEFITLTPLGELHRATDERRDKSVALTLLAKSVAENAETVKELESKAGKLHSISHPNLTSYIGFFQTPTLAFLLEDWVDGPSLKDIRRRAIVGAEEALIYTKSVCGALEALHKQNFLHLNLAPELIRIDQRGEIKLGGIANAHRIGTRHPRRLGKYPPLYQPPEALEDQPLDTAADMYSLAVMVYELVTGAWINGRQAPRAHDAIRKAHLEVMPPAPITLNRSLPDHFSRMVLWALRKNPADRFKTTTELLSSLALAARVSVDDIPLRIDPEPASSPWSAPVTSAVLSDWAFQPPPREKSIGKDTLPLEDRLATLSTPKKKPPRASRVVSIFFLLLFAGLFSLFWFIRPAEVPIEIPPTITPFVADFTPFPTFTPIPRPTHPFGGRIVFTCTRADYNQLCMINRDGSGLVQLTDMAASNYYPIFTRDHESILFASNRNGPFDLYLLAFIERDVIQVTNRVGNVVSPDYSPDGRTIVFANRVGDGLAAIWMVNADGLNPRLVFAGAGDIVAVAWSPDGERLAYAMSLGAPQEYEIFIMDADGRNHRRISQGLQGIGGSVQWAPDGSHLLIHAGPFGDKDIYKLDVNTGNAIRITDGGNNASASYSPDGLYIVFNSMRNDEQADLYIMRADGTNQVQLTNHPEPDWGARWVE